MNDADVRQAAPQSTSGEMPLLRSTAEESSQDRLECHTMLSRVSRQFDINRLSHQSGLHHHNISLERFSPSRMAT